MAGLEPKTRIGLLLLGGAGAAYLVWKATSNLGVDMLEVRWVAEPPKVPGAPVVPLRFPVDPRLLAAVQQAAKELKMALVVTGAGRTDADARMIYTWGRTVVNPYTGPLPGKPLGDIASNATSASNTAHGFKRDGKAHALDVHPDDSRGFKRTVNNYRKVADVMKRMGLVAGIDFNVGDTPDYPHFETPNWRAL